MRRELTFSPDDIQCNNKITITHARSLNGTYVFMFVYGIYAYVAIICDSVELHAMINATTLKMPFNVWCASTHQRQRSTAEKGSTIYHAVCMVCAMKGIHGNFMLWQSEIRRPASISSCARQKQPNQFHI